MPDPKIVGGIKDNGDVFVACEEFAATRKDGKWDIGGPSFTELNEDYNPLPDDSDEVTALHQEAKASLEV